VRDLLKSVGLRGLIPEMETRGLETDGEVEQWLERLEDWFDDEAEREAQREQEDLLRGKKNQKNRERDAGAKNAREERKQQRKKAMEAKALKAEQQRQREQNRVKRERRREGQERDAMKEEEERCIAAEKAFRDAELWAEGAEHARIQLVELNQAREEEEKLKAMMLAGQERARLHEAKEKKLREMREAFLREQVTLEGDTDGYGFDSDDVAVVRPGVKRLQRDVYKIRARKMEGMLQQKALEAKWSAYKKQLMETGQKMRQMQRAIRAQRKEVDSKNFRGTKSVARREIRKMETIEGELHLQVTELQQLVKQNGGELDIANAAVQKMTTVQEDTERDVYKMQEELKTMYAARALGSLNGSLTALLTAL
jgi:hypothetical protein